jgi:RNA polymerase sigma-70 factor (ECF subfamily)
VTDESDWIQMARKGDQAAFGRLVLAYQTHVYNMAYRMLGNATEAEDAAQEVFLRVYTNLHRYDPRRSFRTWLLSIASHYCIDRIRRRRIAWLPLEDEIAQPAPAWGTASVPGPQDAVIKKERDERIQALLARLRPTDRAAITLCYWYDCSYEEIADALGLTISAVKSRLYRARRALAVMMRGQSSHEEPACPGVPYASPIGQNSVRREEVCYAV